MDRPGWRRSISLMDCSAGKVQYVTKERDYLPISCNKIQSHCSLFSLRHKPSSKITKMLFILCIHVLRHTAATTVYKF